MGGFQWEARVSTRNDPVHGHIPIGPYDAEMMDLRSVRQLRYKTQLGFVTEVFESAWHPRFVHVRGTAHNGRRVGECVGLPPEDIKYLIVAGWMHDTPHYPFSHAPERAVPIPHDEAFDYILFGRDFGHIEAAEVLSAFERMNIDPMRMHKILRGPKPGEEPDILAQFISNKVLDIDKLDYIPRDLYMGLFQERVDIGYIISELALHDGKFGIRNGASTNLAQLIGARSFGFERIYAHHKVHAGETQLTYAMQFHPPFASLQKADKETQYKACSALHATHEWDLLKQLSESEHPLTAKLGNLLLGSERHWYKLVAQCGHDSNAERLEALVSKRDEIRAACLEEGFLYSDYLARKALKTRHGSLPYFPVWTSDGEEMSFLERDPAAKMLYQRIPHLGVGIYAEYDTPENRVKAKAILDEHAKAA